MNRLGFALLFVLSSVLSANAGGSGEDEGDLDLRHFRSPSRNIYCQYNVNEKTLSCERRSPSYKLVQLSEQSAQRLTYNADHKTDYSIWAGSFELAYGKTWRAPGSKIKCTSSPNGLSCNNGRGRGFSMSKAKISTY
jgi:hypothetical protein